MQLQLTDEQRLIINTQVPLLKILAYAGSGKTSTLQAYAETHSRQRMLYLAFNKATQQSAQLRFPPNVTAKTAHALAYAAVGRQFGRLIGQVMSMPDLAYLLDLPTQAYGRTAVQLAYAVKQTIDRFQQSGATTITRGHIPGVHYSLISDRDILTFPDEIVRAAQWYWDYMTNPRLSNGIGHDTYLKLWQLSQPSLKAYDVILFDEAQDANDNMLAILKQQSKPQIYVGDPHQQIYGWRGAVNAMAQLSGQEYYLTHSFRFGAEIAGIANQLLNLKGETRTLYGDDRITSHLHAVDRTQPYTLLCRTNAHLFNQAIRLSNIAILGGVDALLIPIQSAYALYCGDLWRVTAPQLKIFNTWEEMKHTAEDLDQIDLKFLVRLVEEHGHRLPKLCYKVRKSIVPPEAAEVILSTMHKAKGLEWPQVKIAQDFETLTDEDGNLLTEELNLLYVACTRAVHVLDLTSCPLFTTSQSPKQAKPTKALPPTKPKLPKAKPPQALAA